MKNLIVCGLVLGLCFTFCKKKETAPPAPTNSTGTTTTGGNTYLAPSTGGDYCSLQTTYTYYDNGTTVVKDSQVVASFYSIPPTSTSPTNIYGGAVTLNGDTLTYSSAANLYYTSTPINIGSTLNWSVSGSGTVTPFSQSFTPTYAKYTGGNLLPDTCIKANGVTITISGVTNNQSSVVIYLNAGSASAFKYIFGSTGSVSFTSAELVSFTVNQPLTISIYFTNTYTAIHSGVKRGFANIVNYQKTSYLK